MFKKKDKKGGLDGLNPRTLAGTEPRARVGAVAQVRQQVRLLLKDNAAQTNLLNPKYSTIGLQYRTHQSIHSTVIGHS